MKPPDGSIVHDSFAGQWWIGKDGILYSIAKRNAHKPTEEESQHEIEKLRAMVGEKKVCMIVDVTYASASSREGREQSATQLEKIVQAMAIVTSSPLGRMVANMFFSLKPPSYPIKMFNNPEDAQKWIGQFV